MSERRNKTALSITRKELFHFRLVGVHDAAALANRENLIGLHLGETLDLLRRRPLHFQHVDYLRRSQSKVQPQIALRHNAGPGVNLVHLRVLPGDDAYPRSDRTAIALRSDQLDLDPVLRVAA